MKVSDSAVSVCRALERMGVRYYVGGSLASSLHGVPRATNDADIVALLMPQQHARLQNELGSRFYVDADEFALAVKHQKSFNLIDEVELAKVDVFCVQDIDYQAAALTRTVRLALEADDPFTQVAVASVEDTIVSKLRWYRLGGEVSDRQWSDLEGLVQAQRDSLDLAYIRQWGERLGVLDLFERLWMTSAGG